MKHQHTTLAASLLIVAISACGQNSTPEKSAPAKPPAEPGTRAAPAPPTSIPHDSASVVVPPNTDPKAVTPAPENVDPGIHGDGDVDKRNREKTEKLQQKH